MNETAHPLVSMVIPVFNEESNVPALLARLAAVADGEPSYDWEFVFVDDGSRDRTGDLLGEAAHRDRRVRLVQFTRNFGHQIAISAGLDAARGQAVISLDGDMQHPPELVPEFLRRWERGHKVVVGMRHATAAGAAKRCTSRLFYWLLRKLTDVPITADCADFRLMDRQAVKALQAMPERSRFLRGLVSWMGFDTAVVPYKEIERASGETKYSFLRMMRLAANAITSFSAHPLRFATLLGLITIAGTIVYAVYTVCVLLLFPETVVHGWTSLILTMLFLGGVQLLSLGVVGEYISRIYDEVKARPLYLVKRKIGFDGEAQDAPGAPAD